MRIYAVIFVTASDDERSIQEGFLAGGQDYVSKPFRPLELLARVKNQIRIVSQSERLKDAYQELDLFCHNVSHDLKSPLLVLRQLAAMLTDTCSDRENEETEIISGLLDEKCSQLLEMVERLLELSHTAQIRIPSPAGGSCRDFPQDRWKKSWPDWNLNGNSAFLWKRCPC